MWCSLDEWFITHKEWTEWRNSAEYSTRQKCPEGKPAASEFVLKRIHVVDPIIFEEIKGEAIKQAALHTHGASGPSGVDAYAWLNFCFSLQGSSISWICKALIVHCQCPSWGTCNFRALSSIPSEPWLESDLGVRDVPRRVIAKEFLRIISGDIAAAPLWLVQIIK